MASVTLSYIATMLTQLTIVLTVTGSSGADDVGRVEPAGLAAGYVADRGITADSDVIFADDFESWKAGGIEPVSDSWRVRRNNVSRTRVISGNVELQGNASPGKRILEIACWTPGSGSQAGGLSLKLGNYNHGNEGLGDGYEELFIRYYIKFDEHCRTTDTAA